MYRRITPQTKHQVESESSKRNGYGSLSLSAVTVLQKAELEEESLQGKFETVQKLEEEEPLQRRLVAQKQLTKEHKPIQKKVNNTGLPDNLKSGIETLSGMNLDHVQVHYNSSQPAQLNALAYAQGSNIHVAPGQEQHLPHEAWHVVQQAQGRVRPTMQMKDGVAVNDDKGLEHEADVMGAKAAIGQIDNESPSSSSLSMSNSTNESIQCAWIGARPLNAAGLRSIEVKDTRGKEPKEETPFQHVHMFFEDDKLPPNIGFHEEGTFVETDKELLSQYKNVGGGFDDGIMRQAVLACNDLAASTKYTAFGTNCQWYVDQLVKEYGTIPEAEDAPFGERTGLLDKKENRRRYWGKGSDKD